MPIDNDKRTNLVLQSFGRESEYKRAILTVLSYYSHSKLPLDKTKVILFTDNPNYFSAYLEGLPIHYVLLTAGKIRAMRGAIDFLHRMKIAIIEEAFMLTNEGLLYADSDTFFTADPTPLMEQVTAGRSFMHEWEYRFEELSTWPLPMGVTFRDFLSLIESKSFRLSSGEELIVTPKHVSWNAGVMMFHSSHARFIPDVYALTDQFYPLSLNHASEQYAFSTLLQNQTEVLPCDSVIYHYWYRVKKQIIDDYLGAHFNNAWAMQKLADKLEAVKRWTGMLPTYFDQHIWTIRDHAIQSFSGKNYTEGYKWAAKALSRNLLGDKVFIKDVLYHTKNFLLGK
jgi:hypothetical protein